MVARIKKIIENQALTSSSFADEIGVQRSSISHILAGRNKPSLDIILKIATRFAEVETDWLLFGTGQMLKAQNLLQETPGKDPKHRADITPNAHVKETTDINRNESGAKSKGISKILIFYSDQTFEEFSPSVST